MLSRDDLTDLALDLEKKAAAFRALLSGEADVPPLLAAEAAVALAKMASRLERLAKDCNGHEKGKKGRI